MNPGEIGFFVTVYTLLGGITAMIYDKGGKNRRSFSELLAVGSLWPLFLVLSLGVGYVRLLLRMMSLPRLTNTVIKNAQDEAKGVSITRAEWR